MPVDVRTDGLVAPHPHGWEAFYRLEKIAAIVVAGLALYLAITETLGWVPFAIGALAGLVMLFVRWPYGAILELLVAGSIPRWFVRINKWNAKPEHFVAVAVGLMLLFQMIARKHERKALGRVGFLLLAFLAMNFFSSTVDSPDPSSTLRWALLLTLAVSPFFLLWQIISTTEQLHKIMLLWLWVGALGALFGILCFASYLVFRTDFGMSFFSFLDFMPAVNGSLWEPNIFGSYCTCFAVMFLFYFLDGARRNPWYLAGFLVTTFGGMLSLARQGWICLVGVGGLILFYNLHRSKIRLKHLAPIVASVLIALVVGVTVMVDLSDRMASFTGEAAEDPTVVRRAGLITLATQDIQEHPIIGLGTSSFQLLYIADDDTSYEGVDKAWLGSLFFDVMHDTGLIGMILFLGLIVELGRRAWRVLAAPVSTSASTAVGALSAGLLVLLIAYQFTDASTLAFTWIQFGLMAVALQIAAGGSGRIGHESI
jgi:O-Antigen ligase